MVREERRKFPRLNMAVTVKYKVLTDMEKNIFSDFETYVNEARSKNISVDGICINSAEPAPPGTILALEMIFPEQKLPLRALGRVVWSKQLDKSGDYHSGVEFVAIKDRYFDQMAQLIAEYVVNKYKIKDSEDRKGLIDILAHLFRKEK